MKVLGVKCLVHVFNVYTLDSGIFKSWLAARSVRDGTWIRPSWPPPRPDSPKMRARARSWALWASQALGSQDPSWGSISKLPGDRRDLSRRPLGAPFGMSGDMDPRNLGPKGISWDTLPAWVLSPSALHTRSCRRASCGNPTSIPVKQVKDLKAQNLNTRVGGMRL